MPSQGEAWPLYLKVVPCIDKDFVALDRLTGTKKPPVQHLRSRSRDVAYIMGYASGKDFELELWRKETVECESGEFGLLYPGRPFNFGEANN